MARRRPKGRDVDGILLLDKPIGMTSNAALQTVKRLFKASKAGHTGNLDPLATGLLPICFGEATKISTFLLDSDKRYIGTCKLGVRTSTADTEGEILETRPVGEFSERQVRAVVEDFCGQIEQIPPMYSAVKVNGTPLYKLAREGKEIERKSRRVTIYEINVLRLEGDELEIDLRCSKGTYVRTLAEDIGAALGCGAHLSTLRRTASGPFQLEHAVTLQELEHLAESGFEALDALLVPMEEALSDWPMVSMSENTAYYLQQGQAVQVPGAPTSGWVRLHREDGKFLGIGQILDDGRVAPKRLIKAAE
jgi:tRNA pseudouridine55 synthase